ncbi:MAG: hypothetical protein SH850_24105 [Planctomycetaceae bacterium]|nr:hypothetical protein [Planctomycetaceae bacterium]
MDSTPSTSDGKTLFVVTLQPTGRDSRPPVYRLRALLKIALRACGLKCVRLVSGDAEVAP